MQHYGLEVQKREPTGEAAMAGGAMRGEGGWIAAHLGSSQALHHRPTAMDVDALLSHTAPHNSTGQELSDIAFERRLQLSAAAATERWAEMREKDEAVRLQLALTNYRELQQQLRVRVAPPAVTEGGGCAAAHAEHTHRHTGAAGATAGHGNAAGGGGTARGDGGGGRWG